MSAAKSCLRQSAFGYLSRTVFGSLFSLLDCLLPRSTNSVCLSAVRQCNGCPGETLKVPVLFEVYISQVLKRHYWFWKKQHILL